MTLSRTLPWLAVLCAAACATPPALYNQAIIDGGVPNNQTWTSTAFLYATQANPSVPAELYVRISTGGADCQTGETCIDLQAFDVFVAVDAGVDGSGNPLTAPPTALGTYNIDPSNSAVKVDFFELDDSCSPVPPGVDTATSGSIVLNQVAANLGAPVAGTFDVMLPLAGHITGAFTTSLCADAVAP